MLLCSCAASPSPSTLPLHAALPISLDAFRLARRFNEVGFSDIVKVRNHVMELREPLRSEEHTSELQSHHDLVCRLLLEKKKQGYVLMRRLRAALQHERVGCYLTALL